MIPLFPPSVGGGDFGADENPRARCSRLLLHLGVEESGWMTIVLRRSRTNADLISSFGRTCTNLHEM